MVPVQELIDLLNRVKHEHYNEPEGLISCPAANVAMPPGPCDCGAAEINAEIDAMIARLKACE